MNFTKIVKAHLESPCRELSNGLGNVPALVVFWELIVCVFILGVQSSCNHELNNFLRVYFIQN